MKSSIVIGLLFSLAAGAQKLKVNKYDKDTRRWQLETFTVNLKTAPGIEMDISLSYVDSTFFVQLKGSGIGANVADVNDPVIFLFDNDSTVTVKSPTVQLYDYSGAVHTYKHNYVLSFKDLEYLSKHNIQALRKYSTLKYDDVYIEPKNAVKVKESSLALIEELKKENVLQPKAPAIAPRFPGGNEVLLSFLNRNLKPPPELPNGEKKILVVQFLVKADGSVSDIQIKQSPGLSFDNELLRVLKRMPKWKPASENGKAVDAVVTQTVTFFRPAE